MTYSIYHFFVNLIQNKQAFGEIEKLEDFPIDETQLAYRGKSSFPDMALKVNPDQTIFKGGELIELKTAKSFTVASFNSQIPQERKELNKLPEIVLNTMRQNDPETDKLPLREVYYWVRGGNKICLLSGKFFETVTVSALIQSAFEQVIGEQEDVANMQIIEDLKKKLSELNFEQESFSKTRNVDNASVSIRFRIMTQAVGAGNILSSTHYPQIANNTLSLILPYHTSNERDERQHLMRSVMEHHYEDLEQFELKHPYNGSFWVFQTDI